MDAYALAEQEQWAKPLLTGFLALRAALDNAHADGVLRWWRDGVNATESGKQFISEFRGRKCLMTVAALAGQDGGAIAVAGARGRQTVTSDRRYFEIICEPGKHVSMVETIARARIESRREDGVYAHGKPVTVVAIDEVGTFPASSAPTDIAAGDHGGTDLVSGVQSAGISFVSAEDGVRGRLAA
jgi:hypothetical protein